MIHTLYTRAACILNRGDYSFSILIIVKGMASQVKFLQKKGVSAAPETPRD